MGTPGTLVACHACKSPVQIPAAGPTLAPVAPQDLGLRQQTSGRCIASLVLGITALIPYVGFITGILAVIFGYSGIKQVKASPQLITGKGLGIAGIVLGIVGFVLWIFLILAAVVFVLVSDIGGTSPSPTTSSTG